LTLLVVSVVLFLAGAAMVFKPEVEVPPADESPSAAERAEEERLDRVVEAMLEEAEKLEPGQR
tara:strand:- start:275 stop:463 length:189 start_codon:yes stop_codon:yes gene_type:complete